MQSLSRIAIPSKAAEIHETQLNQLIPARGWIRPLATPYLRGYRAVAESRDALQGYWFLRPRTKEPPSITAQPNKRPDAAGFFVGYIVSPGGFEYLAPQPPECIAFVFLAPGGSLHNRHVAEKDGLVRKTFDYIRLLTHRPPRFVFQEAELAAMTRHQPMRDWPQEKYEHYSRNFFIETLALLVRSGIVRKLVGEPVPSGEIK